MFSFMKFAARGLRYHRGRYAALTAGVALTGAVLTGGLAVGDSVRGSLLEQSARRLGGIRFILDAGDRTVTSGLASRTGAAGVLRAVSVASADGGRLRLVSVQTLGIDRTFQQLFDESTPVLPGPGEAVINSRLAARLNLKPGAVFLLRLPKPSALPADAPFVSREGRTIVVRVRVKAVIDSGMARFSPRISQLVQPTAFLDLGFLSRRLGIPGRVNLLLRGAPHGDTQQDDLLQKELGRAFRLEDAGLTLRAFPKRGYAELTGDRVFLGPEADAALAASGRTQRILSYFVNSLQHGGRGVPYSFVAAGEGVLPFRLKRGEAAVNSWLARELALRPGGRLTLRYFRITDAGRLAETNASFRVVRILPMQGAGADRTLMPDFPGLSDAPTCRQWDPGLPIDLDRIRKQDETYWNRYRGAPKAYLALGDAVRLWKNRYGSLTAVRYRLGAADLQQQLSALRARIEAGLSPRKLGLVYRDALSRARRAGRNSVDFGELFLGLSFFLILSALILTALLFALAVEERRGEVRTLLSLGHTRAQVRGLFLRESLPPVLFGAVIGGLLGLLYDKLVLLLLGTVWQGAVGGKTEFSLLVRPLTLLTGIAASFSAALFTVLLTLRRTMRRITAAGTAAFTTWRKAPSRRSGVLSGASLAAGLIVILIGLQGGAGIPAFFGGGFLLLASGLFGLDALLRRRANHGVSHIPTAALLGQGNAARRRGRSLALTGLLATGVFMMTAVAANRRDLLSGAWTRGSGTGGLPSGARPASRCRKT